MSDLSERANVDLGARGAREIDELIQVTGLTKSELVRKAVRLLYRAEMSVAAEGKALIERDRKTGAEVEIVLL